MLFALITNNSSCTKICLKKRKQRRKFRFHQQIQCVERGLVDTLCFKYLLDTAMMHRRFVSNILLLLYLFLDYIANDEDTPICIG